MPNVRVHRFSDLDGEPAEAPVAEAVFAAEVSADLLHRAVRIHLLNRRQGTAATKTRGEVAGGGRKPWAQKHTGRARHGSTRSPLWRHGGVTFGPQPREWSLSLPARMRRKALSSALSARYAAGKVWVVDRIGFERPRTKDAIALLGRLGCPAKTLVVVAPAEYGIPVAKSFRNIPGVTCVRADALTTYDVVAHDGILFTEAALRAVEGRLSHG